jgi:hypothetical protein
MRQEAACVPDVLEQMNFYAAITNPMFGFLWPGFPAHCPVEVTQAATEISSQDFVTILTELPGTVCDLSRLY